MVLVNVALALLNCLLALPNCFDPTERCLNGGVCTKQITDKAHSTACSCSAGYGGEKCEKVIDICEAFPRYCNAGTCVNVNGSAICQCPMGYFGQNCEYTFDKCKLGDICRNGGTCIDDICFCTDGFSGELCERHIPERDDYFRAGCDEHPEFCALRFADGNCNEECNNEKCFFDGFDCVASAQKCRLSDYCALHYMDEKCDEKCAVAECGYDGMDCNNNMFLRDLAESNMIGIIFDASPVEVLDKLYSLLARLAQKLHNPVHLALDNNNKTRIYEWSFENGVGKQISLKEQWKMSRDAFNMDSEVTNNFLTCYVPSLCITLSFLYSPKNYCFQFITDVKTRKTKSIFILKFFINATGVLLYVDISSTFCEQRLHANKSDVLPCFTDIFGATAYLHSALYDEDKNRISLDDVTVGGLFVESSRSRPLSVTIICCTCFVLIGITLSCFCGVHGFRDVLKERNTGKNRAPIWKIPSFLKSNVTNQSIMLSSHGYLPYNDTCQKNGLPPFSNFLPHFASNRQKQSENLVEGESSERVSINLDACFSDNSAGDFYLGADLLKAIKRNDVRAVSSLVLYGADVNCSDSDKNTALHHAVIVNNDQIIRLLLNTQRCNFRSVNILGQTPLTLTVKFAHVSDLCARCILDFMYAEYNRQTESLNKTSSSHMVALPPHNGSSESLFRSSNNVLQFDPVMKSEGLVGCIVVRDMLCEKDDPTLTDIFGRTALHYAALNRRVELLSALYSFGLKLNTEDGKGETPLYLAAREGHLDVVNLLLSFGANSGIADQLGRTPLDVARERNHYFVVERLKNAAVNNVDMIKTSKQKRIRKSSYTAKSEWKKKPHQIPVSSQDTILLNSSNTAIGLNEDYIKNIDDTDDDMVISSSLLNSIKSFVLTPPRQILEDTENELDLNDASPAVRDYIDLSTVSSLPSEVFPSDAFLMEPYQVDENTELYFERPSIT